MAKTLSAEEIVGLLKEPPVKEDTYWYDPERRIYRESYIRALIAALRMASAQEIRLGARLTLIRLLGERNAISALPLLVRYIDDPSPNIRGGVADAILHVAWGHYDSHPERIAAIGDPSLGEVLLTRFIAGGAYAQIRSTLALVFAALRYRPAIPALIKALSDSDEVLRRCAADALADLDAKEAIQPLSDAIARETADYVREKMEKSRSRIIEE